MAEKQQFEAVISDIKGRGDKRYAVTRLTPESPRPKCLRDGDTVTFSLSEWKGEHEPEKGQIVVLSDLEEFSKGWRSRNAEPRRA